MTFTVLKDGIFFIRLKSPD